MSWDDLRDRLQRYLALRRALGFRTRLEEKLLWDFVSFLERRGWQDPIPASLAVEWACSTSNRRGAAAQRLGVVRRWLTHLRAADSRTEVPAFGLLPHSRRPKPHIYSDWELEALLAAARSLGPRGALRAHTISTLIGLLASSGLRAGEAMRLSVADVDIDGAPARLLIHESKFRKSRIVPLHPSTADALRAYVDERRRLGYDGVCSSFFVSETAGPLNHRTTSRTFVNLTRQIGIRGLTRQRGPSLHDLRHTFAVRRLVAWYRNGVDVHARLPELSVYLGHARPEESYWYLTATPELLTIAADRFEAYFGQGGVR